KTDSLHNTMRLPSASDINLDIDQYTNRIIPSSQVHRLPISRFLGHRNSPAREIGDLVVCAWSFVGAFCGILLVAGVFQSSPLIQSHHPPLIIASLGATAILDYHTIQSPLAQPRSSILGHAFSAIVGVGITKLFMLRDDFESLRWIAGAVSCAAASSIMGITKTVHPPGGATALLAAVDPSIGKLGWYFVALVILGSLLMLLCALLINNIQRQFPVFWWTPQDVGKQTKNDIEAPVAEKETVEELLVRIGPVSERDTIIITPAHIIVPEGFDLGQEECGILEILRDRLRERHGVS
ncbi:unnamed protein product, partial [Penicillium nalgiovense]